MVATTHTKGALQVSSRQTSVVVVDVHGAKVGIILETTKQNKGNIQNYVL